MGLSLNIKSTTNIIKDCNDNIIFSFRSLFENDDILEGEDKTYFYEKKNKKLFEYLHEINSGNPNNLKYSIIYEMEDGSTEVINIKTN